MQFGGLLPYVCAAALTVGCNGNRADNTIVTDSAVGTAGGGVSSDKSFVNEMLSAGTAEVETAKNALPTVKHHLHRAKEIKDQIDHRNATAQR